MVSLKVLWDLILAIFTIFPTIRENKKYHNLRKFTVVEKRWNSKKNQSPLIL